MAFLNVNGYYGSLFRFFDDAAEAGLLMAAHRAAAQRAATVGEAVAIATGPAPVNVSKWVDPTI